MLDSDDTPTVDEAAQAVSSTDAPAEKPKKAAKRAPAKKAAAKKTAAKKTAAKKQAKKAS
jgi:hypothetical protein